MRVSWRLCLPTLGLLAIAIGHGTAARADPAATDSIPTADLVQPEALATELRQASESRPLIVQVGFRVLFDEAHIASAVYAGPGNSGAGLKSLRTRLAAVPKHRSIVIYCGCCPWEHCPNVAAAYEALHRLGFDHVRVLYLAENFGHDWVQPGYPIDKGA